MQTEIHVLKEANLLSLQMLTIKVNFFMSFLRFRSRYHTKSSGSHRLVLFFSMF